MIERCKPGVFDEQDLFSRDSLGNLYHCRGEGMLPQPKDSMVIYCSQSIASVHHVSFCFPLKCHR